MNDTFSKKMQLLVLQKLAQKCRKIWKLVVRLVHMKLAKKKVHILAWEIANFREIDFANNDSLVTGLKWRTGCWKGNSQNSKIPEHWRGYFEFGALACTTTQKFWVSYYLSYHQEGKFGQENLMNPHVVPSRQLPSVGKDVIEIQMLVSLLFKMSGALKGSTNFDLRNWPNIRHDGRNFRPNIWSFTE